MSLRYHHEAFCERCNRVTPHTKRGQCAACASKVRTATRRAKASAQGSPLVRFGDLLKVAWDLWSVWIRAKATGCAMCGAPLPPEALQGAHGFSRTDRGIMFHLDNVWALCSACHRRHTPPRQPWLDWMEAQLGPERFERLKYLSRVAGKLRLSDLHLITIDARNRISQLPEGDRKDWAREREGKILERMVRLGVKSSDPEPMSRSRIKRENVQAGRPMTEGIER